MVELTKDTFKEYIESYPIVLVDFWAEWCGPCKKMVPALEKFNSEQDKVIVAKINVDDFPEIAREFRVMSIPTMILFQNGRPNINRIIGATSLEKLEETIESYLSPVV